MEQIDIKSSARSRRDVKLAQLLEKEEDGENAIFLDRLITYVDKGFLV